MLFLFLKEKANFKYCTDVLEMERSANSAFSSAFRMPTPDDAFDANAQENMIAEAAESPRKESVNPYLRKIFDSSKYGVRVNFHDIAVRRKSEADSAFENSQFLIAKRKLLLARALVSKSNFKSSSNVYAAVHFQSLLILFPYKWKWYVLLFAQCVRKLERVEALLWSVNVLYMYPRCKIWKVTIHTVELMN